MQYEKKSRAKAILVEKDVDGILERGNIIIAAYLGDTGPKLRIGIGQHRLIADLSQIKDLADAMIDVAEQLDDDMRFYGGTA